MAKSFTKTSWGKLGGGTGRMHQFHGAGPQTPDRTSQESKSTSRRDIAVQSGGSNAGFYRDHSKSGQTSKEEGKSPNRTGAGPQTPGQSASAQPRQDGFAHGGTTRMWGNRGSV